MLVKHLIRELSKFDPELEVIIESFGLDGDTCLVDLVDNMVYIQCSEYKGLDLAYDNTKDTPRPYGG